LDATCAEHRPSLLQVPHMEDRSTDPPPAGWVGLELITVFSVECKPYHDWQTVTLHKSWKDSGIPGRLVRLWACPLPSRKRSTDLSSLPGLETHVHEVALQEYTPLNKPWGLLSWVTKGGGREIPNDAVVMIIDCDMVFYAGGKAAATLLPLVERVHSGAVLGNDYKYTVDGLRRQNWQLAAHFNVSGVDSLQSIGVPILLRKDTLLKFVSSYYRFTKEMAQDPTLKALVHDGRVPAPWITEMVGYTLAAAGIHHETHEQWPALGAPHPPWSSQTDSELLVHYPHAFRLCGRAFGKRLYFKRDLLNCSTDRRVLAALKPPSQAEALAASCTLCLKSGDAFGVPPRCDLPGKVVGLFAWERVYDAVSSWRSEHCS